MRKKTNSVTELVKEVAYEVIHNYIERKEFVTYPQMEALINYKTNTLHYQKGEKSSKPSRSYASWSIIEDNGLKEEMNGAIRKIAEKHERSVAAILCRVNQKSILYSDA